MAVGDNTKMRDRHIPAYQEVMRSLISFYGSINKAMLVIGISEHAYYRLMNDDELVVSVARKIMTGYSTMRAERAAA